MAFMRHHATMLLRYSGISFISGAVNHGFFSGSRSLWTAAVGVVLFAAAFWMERREEAPADAPPGGAWRTLGWSALLSVGLGFFTGGLQHFPDSPDRSAWVVPLGFVISVVALVRLEDLRWSWPLARYGAVAGVAVVAASLAAWQWLPTSPLAGDGHGHGDGDTHAAGPRALVAQVVGRTVEVGMGDDMRFDPPSLQVRAGETVRLRVRNHGRLEHELVIGTAQELREHAAQMRAGAGHAHGGAAITLPPGGEGELVVTFGEAGTLDYACLVPGHFEAGMRGSVLVAQAGAAGTEPAPPTAAPGTAPPAAPAAKPAAPHTHTDTKPHRH